MVAGSSFSVKWDGNDAPVSVIVAVKLILPAIHRGLRAVPSASASGRLLFSNRQSIVIIDAIIDIIFAVSITLLSSSCGFFGALFCLAG